MLKRIFNLSICIVALALLAALNYKSVEAMSKEDLAEAIEAYVNKETDLKKGYFTFYDSVNNEPLALTLVKIHKDKLATVGDGVHFFCVDFSGTNGKVFDLDFFMKGPDKDHLKVTEIVVHKEEGKERYTWYEKGGIWKKKWLTAMEGSGKEHPKEQPKAEEHHKDQPKVEEHHKDHPKAEEHHKDQPKAEEQPKEEPKAKEHPKEQPKEEEDY